MWLFDPAIAKHRMTHSLVLRFLSKDGPSRFSRRTGWTVRTDSPEVFPLIATEPATIMIEYLNSRQGLECGRMAVAGLTTKEPTEGNRLLVVVGEKKGLVVNFICVIQDKVMVKQASGGSVFGLSKLEVCPLED